MGQMDDVAKALAATMRVELVTIWLYYPEQGDRDGYVERIGACHQPPPKHAVQEAYSLLYGEHNLVNAKGKAITIMEALPKKVKLDISHPMGVLGNAVVEKKVMVTKLMVDERYQTCYDSNSLFDAKVDGVPGFRTSDIMCVPLLKSVCPQQRAIGAIQFVNRHDHSSFGSTEQSMAVAAAQIASMTVLSQHF